MRYMSDGKDWHLCSENSWYFRNALVRANYNDMQNGVHATTKYLELFFENLLMNRHHELKNRYLHLDFVEKPYGNIQSANETISKCKNCTLNCTLDEMLILQGKGYIRRLNGRRNGSWEVLVERFAFEEESI